jgi:hypothetical protein
MLALSRAERGASARVAIRWNGHTKLLCQPKRKLGYRLARTQCEDGDLRRGGAVFAVVAACLGARKKRRLKGGP